MQSRVCLAVMGVSLGALVAASKPTGRQASGSYVSASSAQDAFLSPEQSRPNISAAEMLRWISDLYNIGERRPGTAAGHKAERYVANFLSQVGLKDVHLDPIRIKVWRPAEWSFAVGGLPGQGFEPAGPKARRLPCFYIPYTAFTGRKGATGELLYVQGSAASQTPGPNLLRASYDRSNPAAPFSPVGGRGVSWGWPLLTGARRGPLSGKMLVADVRFASLPVNALRSVAYYTYDPGGTLPPGMVRTATWVRPNFDAVYGLARDAGAIGFVGILADMPYKTNTYYAPCDGAFKPVPGLWVDAQTGAWLREELKRRRMKATLKLTGSAKPDLPAEAPARGAQAKAGFTNNVIGIVPGRPARQQAGEKRASPASECIIISCHHDSPFRSAVEGASGMAVLMALAKIFAPEAGAPKAHPPSAEKPAQPGLNRTIVFVASAGHLYGDIGAKAFVRRNPGLIGRTVIEISIENIAREFVAAQSGPGTGRLEPTGQVEPRALFVSASPAVREVVREAIEKYDLRRSFILPASSKLLGSHPPTDGAAYHAAGVPVISLSSWPVYLLQAEDTLDKVAADQLVPVTLAIEHIIRALDRMPAAAIRGSG